MKRKQSQDESLSNAFLTGPIIIMWDDMAKESLSSCVSERYKLYPSDFLT